MDWNYSINESLLLHFLAYFLPCRAAHCRLSGWVQAKVNALRELQSKTQEELDALLPSVLDKASKGEL